MKHISPTFVRPANPENVFRGTFRVKKRDLPAKSGTVGRAHIEIFLEVGIQPTEINCVPKYTVARRFGRGTVWYFCEKSSVTNCARTKKNKNPISYKKRDISMI